MEVVWERSNGKPEQRPTIGLLWSDARASGKMMGETFFGTVGYQKPFENKRFLGYQNHSNGFRATKTIRRMVPGLPRAIRGSCFDVAESPT